MTAASPTSDSDIADRPATRMRVARRGPAWGLAAAALWLLLVLPATVPAAERACASAGKTLALSEQARVYRRAGAIYGCLLEQGRSHRLARLTGEPPSVRLAGRAAALVRPSSARTFDLGTGRVRRSARFAHAIERFVLLRNGAFAVETAGQVITVDADGRLVVDPGPGVVPGSLGKDSRYFEWRNETPGTSEARYAIGSSRPSPSCRRGKRTFVVAENEHVRVVDHRYGLLIACRLSDLSHGVRIADDRRDEFEKGGSSSAVLVNGPFVAIFRKIVDPVGYPSGCWIDEWDIEAGVQTAGGLDPGYPRVGDANRECNDTAFVLAPNGTLAWAARPDDTYPGPLGTVIWGETHIRAWARSVPALLDEGPGVDPDSLRLDGFTARWTRAGEAQAFDLASLTR